MMRAVDSPQSKVALMRFSTSETGVNTAVRMSSSDRSESPVCATVYRSGLAQVVEKSRCLTHLASGARTRG